jgi:histone H3/H4
MAEKKKIEIPMMVVTSKVKEFISQTYSKRTSGEFPAELNEKVARLIDEAVKRCDVNGRETLKPGDL